jgi:hypothetical protein
VTPAGPDAPRSLWPAALVITGAVLALVVIFVAVYPNDGRGHRDDRTANQAEGGFGTRPRIITRPEDGAAPDSPGDPGGWEQLALFGVIVAGLGAVGLLVWRSSRRARAQGP